MIHLGKCPLYRSVSFCTEVTSRICYGTRGYGGCPHYRVSFIFYERFHCTMFTWLIIMTIIMVRIRRIRHEYWVSMGGEVFYALSMNMEDLCVC